MAMAETISAEVPAPPTEPTPPPTDPDPDEGNGEEGEKYDGGDIPAVESDDDE